MSRSASLALSARSMVLLLLLMMVCLLQTPACSGEDAEDVGTVIGIDLGTTYSCVGIFRHGRVDIIANDQGNRITPSYVAFTPEGQRLIGDGAKHQLTSNPENTVYDVKRLIGRSWSDTSVQDDILYYPFKVINQNDKPNIQIQVGSETKVFTPEEISAMVLTKMKQTAEDFLGKKVTHAVVTVPAYFNDAQRIATKDAGTIAGLNVMKIINEPTAAAIAYGLDQQDTGDGEKHILVFDLGGGTFDVSLLVLNKYLFRVLATGGNNHLGGEDFDHRVVKYFIEFFRKKTGLDIHDSSRAVQKLRCEVEKAKRILSYQHQVRIEIDYFYGGKDFSETLSRAKFEELNLDLFYATQGPLKDIFGHSDYNIEAIHDVVLVGGSTRIPKIQQIVKEFFNGKEPSKGINPDEAVAYGAAIQGGMLGGQKGTEDLVIYDITPLSLGTEIVGEVMSTIIKRNTVIPHESSGIYTTTTDNQHTFGIRIYEGERVHATDNHLLGRFTLTDIPPMPQGMPQVEITFNIDANGILHVSATEKSTGNTASIVISNDRNHINSEQIDRMIREAKQYAKEDQIWWEQTRAKHVFESFVLSVRKQIIYTDVGSKLSEANLKLIEGEITRNVNWMESNPSASVDELNMKHSNFETVVYTAMGSLYRDYGKFEL